MTQPSYRDSHLQKGQDYDETFNKLPHRAMLWKLERRLLTHLIAKLYPKDKPTHLDFACGTGRILAHLEKLTGKQVGADVSPTMLEVARSNVPSATIIQCDLTKDAVPEIEEFDLITAFRFFPNAEPELRLSAMKALAKRIKPGGYLVFNNHKHSKSSARRMAVLLGRGQSATEFEDAVGMDRVMSRREVKDLVTEAGMKIVKRYPLGSLPCTDRHMFIHSKLLYPLEIMLGKFQLTERMAQDIIYVCGK